MDEIYSSVQQTTSAQIKIEGSRFIADIIPVEDEESAKRALEAIRKKYFDATHHCYAYIIGGDKQLFRYSDDGEPAGTAGIKIYKVIQSKNLSDILLVVTRYFGGTKLGVGGLGRAYIESAAAVLSEAKIISKGVMREVTVSFPFSETNHVMNLVNVKKLRIVKTDYLEDRTLLTLTVFPSQLFSIETLFKNSTKGMAEIRHGGLTTVVVQ